MPKNRPAVQEPQGPDLSRQLGYLKEPEVYGLMGITKGSARNRQSAGNFPPAYKVGRQKLFKITEVEAWIRRRRVSR